MYAAPPPPDRGDGDSVDRNMLIVVSIGAFASISLLMILVLLRSRWPTVPSDTAASAEAARIKAASAIIKKLSPHTLSQRAAVDVESQEGDACTCSICLTGFEQVQALITLPCQHTFHSAWCAHKHENTLPHRDSALVTPASVALSGHRFRIPSSQHPSMDTCEAQWQARMPPVQEESDWC